MQFKLELTLGLTKVMIVYCLLVEAVATGWWADGLALGRLAALRFCGERGQLSVPSLVFSSISTGGRGLSVTIMLLLSFNAVTFFY